MCVCLCVWGGVFKVFNCYRNDRKHRLPHLPCTEAGFNEQLRVPSGDAAMKAALFLVLFILLSSFRRDIHYSFHSSERERR